MSIEKYSQNNGPEKIREEVALLEAIQVGNQLILEESGVLDRARKLLPDLSPMIVDENTKANVTWIRSAAYEVGNDKVKPVPAIRFYTEPEAGALKEIYIIRLEDEDINGNFMLANGLNRDDVELVRIMLNGLQDYKKKGWLADLNDHLTAILDPNDEKSSHPSSNF